MGRKSHQSNENSQPQKRSIAKGRSIACKTSAIFNLTENKEENADFKDEKKKFHDDIS